MAQAARLYWSRHRSRSVGRVVTYGLSSRGWLPAAKSADYRRSKGYTTRVKRSRHSELSEGFLKELGVATAIGLLLRYLWKGSEWIVKVPG